MAITPPTPAARKDKGKQPERQDIVMASRPGSDVAANPPDSPKANTGSSPVLTGSLSKSTLAELEKLFEKIAELIADTLEITELPAEHISKFLGKRLGLSVRGSTSWNGYQTYFTAHMQEELKGIGAEEEYNSASSAQKPVIIARAHAAFKARHNSADEWLTILKAWDDLKTVEKGCGGQTIGTRENKFDAMNRKIIAFVSALIFNEDSVFDHEPHSFPVRRFKTAGVTYMLLAALKKPMSTLPACHQRPSVMV